jgi:hypothetical protein
MSKGPKVQHDAGAGGALGFISANIDQAERFSDSPGGSTSFEHRDAPSHLSICSDKAVAWLRDRVVADDEQLLVETVTRLKLDVQRKRTMDLVVSTRDIPEPDANTAWEYCQGQFPLYVNVL